MATRGPTFRIPRCWPHSTRGSHRFSETSVDAPISIESTSRERCRRWCRARCSRNSTRSRPAISPCPVARRIEVAYDTDQPVLRVRLQEVFGWSDTPRVAGGRVPVVLHLLSPAGRPIQVTADLGGFWRGSYPQVRAEMRGRYPKHDWPEDPTQGRAVAWRQTATTSAVGCPGEDRHDRGARRRARSPAPPHEVAGDEHAHRRRCGVRGDTHLRVRALVAGLRAGDGRGGDGRWARRLVRGHRAVSPSARPAHPAHRRHQDAQGAARSQSRRVRARELPGPRGGHREVAPRPHRRAPRALVGATATTRRR